jgi:cytochrome c oxidase subunit 3
MFIGLANYMNDESGLTLTYTGLFLLLLVIYGWFSYVVNESEAGLYDAQVDMSFRWGMAWFIFSEIMFFAAFFLEPCITQENYLCHGLQVKEQK